MASSLETESSTQSDTIKNCFKKKKVVLLIAYSGIGYSGMQCQLNDPTIKTIEGELFKALALSNAVTKQNLHPPSKMSFQRCSRTDKNVSAMHQVVSLKINIQPNIITMINKYLPENIKVFDMIRVSKGFSSKNMCSGRSYRYILPSFAFTKDGKDAITNAKLTEENIDYINSLFSKYIGTLNFANFTAQKEFNDKSCIRYITHFKLVGTFILNGYEMVDIRIDGQSFMLHQIRKMIGFVICIIRGYFSEDDLSQAFRTKNANIPLAPGFGLMLYNTYFSGYNKRSKNKQSVNQPIEWRPEIEHEVDIFTKNIIEKSIIEYEIAENATNKWLAMLEDVHFKFQSIANDNSSHIYN